MKTLTLQLILGAALLAPAPILAQSYSEGEINIPGAVVFAQGIDDNDQVVGYFDGPSGRQGFVLSQGVVAQIEAGYPLVEALGINSVTGIVGYWQTPEALGWLDAKRNYMAFKSGSRKIITGINASGTFVGWDQTTAKGFVNTKGVYTTILPSPCQNSQVQGVNSNGDLVGFCSDNLHYGVGFARIGGVDEVISVFGRPTFPTGINDYGTIAGYFQDASGNYHGFLLAEENATQFDFAGFNTYDTQILGINNRGSLSGTAYDTNLNQPVGFFAFAN